MNTLPSHNKRSFSLAGWTLAFPLSVLASIFTLPRFTSLYGTLYEKLILSVLIVLPLAGAFGIAKYTRISMLPRVLLAFIYFILGVAVALFVDIYLGCSWARACF